ncbi:MAG: hypothetical protein ACKVOW_11290 [Chitinophagaceae bacterium]
MKKIFFPFFGVLLFFLHSCKKRADFELPCKILKMIEYRNYIPENPFQITTLSFNYNSYGEITSLVFDKTETGKPNHYFKYDTKHRLVQYYGIYSPGNYEYFTNYYYNRNNLISYDTSFYAGTDITRPYETFQLYFVNHYSYDAEGRISKIDFTVSTDPNQAIHTFYYSYDINGNLTSYIHGYDNKINFRRTHPLLAFFDRDYSMNNSGTPLSYNSKKLPLAFSRNGIDPQTIFRNMQVTEIIYSCNMGQNKND